MAGFREHHHKLQVVPFTVGTAIVGVMAPSVRQTNRRNGAELGLSSGPLGVGSLPELTVGTLPEP